MKAGELKKDDRFILLGRDWDLKVVDTTYTKSITLKPDGANASLNEQVIIAENERGMRMAIPTRALVKKIEEAEVIPLPKNDKNLTENEKPAKKIANK